MSDGVKAGLGQVAADIGEAIVKPVADEVGKAIEQGAQSVAGTTQKPVDPQEKQRKDLENQKKKAWAMRVIDWHKQIQANQQKVRQENLQKTQAEGQKKNEENKVKQFQVVKKQEQQQQLSVAQVAERRSEIKRGVGG